MDILNPLYLKARKLIRTSAEPNSVVYLATPDPKRDDKFITIAVPIENLAEVIGALSTVVTDGVTITGDGTPGNPLVANLPAAPTVVDISSAQIVNSSAVEIPLLPALPAEQYYADLRIILEYHPNTTDFDWNDNVSFNIWDSDYAVIGQFPATFLNQTPQYNLTYRYLEIAGFGAYSQGGLPFEPSSYMHFAPGKAISLSPGFNPPNSMVGDGTIRAIMTYTVRTLGA